MSEFWVSGKRNFCKFCRIFVYDNASSRSQHESHPAHKNAVQRFVRQIEQKSLKEAKDTALAKRLIGIVDQTPKSSLPTIPSGSSTSTFYKPPTDKDDQDESSFYNPSAYRDYETSKNSAYVGQVGEWEVVEPPAPAPEPVDLGFEIMDPSLEAKPEIKKHALDDDEIANETNSDFKLTEKSVVLSEDEGEASAPIAFKKRKIKGNLRSKQR